MARLVGVDLPRDKRIEIALTYIYGIGRSRSAEILAATGVSPDLRVKDLTDAELVPLRDFIEGNLKVEGGSIEGLGLRWQTQHLSTHTGNFSQQNF